ncbi:MAG: DUF4912 domain-containing protein [Treponema sp.]|nr:DUF4912 domain-containing protein [Treponema sp.]
MDSAFLSRAYLQTLSSTDLIALSDDYGIDIPDDLDRSFIIGELLEAADEWNLEQKEDENFELVNDNSAKDLSKKQTLPESYNENVIGVVLRNPIWAFVYWDFKEATLLKLESDNSFLSIFLRVSFFEDEYDEKVRDSFDVQVSLKERKQYILIPAGKKNFKIELIAKKDSGLEVLAVSKRVDIPVGCNELSGLQPGKDFDFNPVLRLSGLPELLHSHYVNYRQSFS